ncbi:hypothetical protein E2C01_054575 [Portunus trituberculatus]|uniref:Uncharacterized protein n=1 Tax=Portunus trituberculatus TaxID=210409 RepID=A0A5B7GU30_PORTR|nr:hypothetical protein [Portunus trituberculatus]
MEATNNSFDASITVTCSTCGDSDTEEGQPWAKKKKKDKKKNGPLECWLSRKCKSVSQSWGANASIPPS